MDPIKQTDADPWEELERIIAVSDRVRLAAFLDSTQPAETARAISRLSQADQTSLLGLLSPADAADLLEEVTEIQAADLIEDLSPDHAAAILDEMQSDQQADVLAELDEANAEAILQRMRPSEADDVRQLLTYPPDTAGGIMITEFLAYAATRTVGYVLDDMRAHGEKYSDYDVQYAFVTSPSGELGGVLRLREMLFAQPDQRVGDLMQANPLSLSVSASLEELQQFFEDHDFLAVPVVDERRRLVGVVLRLSVQEATDKRANRTFFNFVGIVGREELRSMPLYARASRRLSWLSINVLLNIVAASVIALYQETLERAIILAVFLPIISDMSGCSGNQAVAVSIRELSLGFVKPFEFVYVLTKEMSVGVINGFMLGLLLGGVTLLWKGNAYLGLVVGGSLALNTVLAVALGGLLPLGLRSLKFDPALASGPILTTVTDMCGFLILLSLATAVLPRLAG